ncbi:hypothetical protein TNCV_3544131 [Trichonephila clavipes]|nr:hypothetical protein TNCV_3544131 [Trichonephila clavipes]
MAKNADMHYMYDRANGNGRAELRVHHVQFFDRRMKDHRIIQWLHRQLRETRSLYVTRYDANRRRHVRSPSLGGRILNVVADRHESGTSVSHNRGVTLNTHRAASPLLRLVEGEERLGPLTNSRVFVLLQNWDGTEPKLTVTYMVLKAMDNDRRTSSSLAR